MRFGYEGGHGEGVSNTLSTGCGANKEDLVGREVGEGGGIGAEVEISGARVVRGEGEGER
jgi:hypothetical protein